MKIDRNLGVAVLGVLLLTVTARADTLVLRDGRRVDGELIAVRDGTIEFDAERGSFGRRERIRIDRDDVVRIEFERADRDRFDRDPDRDRDRDRGDDRRPGRPAGMRERDVSVDSWIPWKDTGVDVRAGQTIYFSATGRVRWGPNRQDGPEGERNSPRNERRPIPSRPAAALIGRVGESDDLFFIGDDQGPIRMRSSGRLYLGVNDDYLQDNGGSFRVVVYY
jgi:hypothetical protein